MKKNKIFTDLLYSILALFLMHSVLQILVNPYLNNVMGSEEFGNMISAFGMVTIFAASAGLSVNNTQLKMGSSNKEKETFISAVHVLAVLGTVLTLFFSFKTAQGIGNILFLALIAIFTAYRSYGDVFYRANLNYRGYFLYYLALSIGYIIGLFFMNIVGKWGIVFLCGEIFALFYLFNSKDFGKINRNKIIFGKQEHEVFNSSFLLYISLLIYYLALNFDKIILLYMISGTAVTEFYAASLMGKTFSLLVGSLNAIILSYLVKSKEGMTFKLLNKIFILVITLGIVALLVCMAVTPYLVHILYPQVEVKALEIYVVTNVAQILCFMSSLLLTILLYLNNSATQVKVQAVFTLLIIVIAPILIFYCGVGGYAYATLLVYAVKLLVVSLLCVLSVRRKNKVN